MEHLPAPIKPLNCLLGIVGMLVGLLVLNSVGLAQTKSGYVNITGSVPGPPPSIAAIISTPTTGDLFNSNPITVTGTCPTEGLIISIVDNGKFVGSTICNSSGNYSLKIDLYLGKNRLVAREQDNLNQYGPNSFAVEITYNLASSNAKFVNQHNSSLGQLGIAQLTILLDPRYVGYTNNQSNELLNLPVKLSGGKALYAIYIDWGDGNNSLLAHAKTGSIILAHNYTQGGNYQATIEASDSSGQKATLQVAVIINGKTSAVTSKSIKARRDLTYLWWFSPFAATALVLIGYSFGTNKHQGDDEPLINKPED